MNKSAVCAIIFRWRKRDSAKQWEEIMRHWNVFLELEPDHAEAYFERSGTHYHNGDMQSAKADLQKACELGHQKACQQYEKVKHQY
jgi:hypothetical protein